MLSEFELALYAVVKSEGFNSIDDSNETLVRHAIERYMIGVLWKIKFPFSLEDVPASLVPLLTNKGNTSFFEDVKAQLDPDAYNLGDNQVDALVYVLREGRFDELDHILKQNPVLIHRRDNSLRTLLHHALVWPNAEPAIEFLLARGASLEMKTAANVNAIDYVIQNHNHSYFDLLLPYTYHSHYQFVILMSLLVHHGDEFTCLSVLEKTQAFRFQVNPEQKAVLLSQAIEREYYRFMKALVVSGAPVNMQLNQGNTALHTLAQQEIKYLLGSYESKAEACSFLLATAGVDLSLRNVQGSTAKDTAKVAVGVPGAHLNPYDTILALCNARIYTELALCTNGLSDGYLPVVVLKGADYESLAKAGLLDVRQRIYVVLGAGQSYEIHYKRVDKNITLTNIINRSQLNGDQTALLDALVAWVYPSVNQAVAGDVFSERVKREQKDRFAGVDTQVLAVQMILMDLGRVHQFIPVQAGVASQPALTEDELIQQLKSQYPIGPLPLYEETVQDIDRIAARNGYAKLLNYIYGRIQVLDDLKNLKYLLFGSMRFVYGKRYNDFIIKQPFPADVPFYRLIIETGIPLKVNHVYSVKSPEYQAAGFIFFAKKNKGPVAMTKEIVANPVDQHTPINELDLLKGIKKRYLYVFEKTMSDPRWQTARVSIRDTLVLGLSTLFLNVIRSNRDLTKLKDTGSYVKLCKLMEHIQISSEAADELKQRVLVKANASLRDVVMYLALVCDVENEKAEFIRVCHHYLLAENFNEKDKAALNAALRLLSEKEHEALRDGLMSVSGDPSLLPLLQVRLAKKECAYIEIIRTSAEHREVKDTGKFKTWAAELNRMIQPPVKKSFHLLTFFDAKKHSANFRGDEADEALGLCLPGDRKYFSGV